MLELCYYFKLVMIISLALKFLLESEATLKSKPESQYVLFKHNYFKLFDLLNQPCYNCPIDFKFGIMIPDAVEYNVENIATL